MLCVDDEDEEEKEPKDRDATEPSQVLNPVELTLAKADRMDACLVTPQPQKIARKRSSMDLSVDSGSNKKASSAAGSVCEVASQSGAGPVDTNSKASGVKAGSKVPERVNKLDLQQALAGIKLGLQRHHAVEYLKVVEDASEQVTLKAHLALYDAAVRLSPGEIKSVSDEEITQCLQSLQGTGLEWTEHLQWHLWRRRVKKAQAALSTDVAPEPFAVWWDVVKPYAYSAEQQKLNIHAPTLCAVAGNKPAKQSTFLQSVFIDLLLPFLVQGELFCDHVGALCGAVAGAIDGDFLREIDETFVPLLPKVKDAVLGLKALLSKDLHVQFEHKDQIADLRLAITAKNDDVITKFAKALGGVPHYRSLVDAFVSQVVSIEVHDDKIREVKAFFQLSCFKYGLVDVKNLGSQLKDLSLLSGDLPEVFMQGLRSQASSSTWNWWLSAKEALEKQRSQKAIVDDIGGVLAEATIAFPVEERWRVCLEELAEHIRLTNGNERLEEVFANAKLVENGLESPELSLHLEALSAVCVKAAGLEAASEDKPKLRGVFKAMLTKMEAEIDKDHAMTTALWECMTAVQKFQSDVATADAMKHCSQVLQLTQSLQEWEASTADGRPTVWGDESRKKLAELMRCHDSCKDIGTAGCWASTTVCAGLAKAAAIIQEKKVSWTDQAKEAVQAALDALTQVAGGADNGAPWNQKLTPTSTWADMMMHAQQLRTIEFVASVRDKLHKMLEACP